MAAVTSSVSSRMPLREERKVLSTAKPWSPAAAPSSGGRSRRSRAPSISVGPAGTAPCCQRPRKGNRKVETWQMGKQTRERRHLRNPKVKRAGLLWGPRRRQAPPGRPAHMGLRPAAQSDPAGACTGPQEAHGEGNGGRGCRGVASPPGLGDGRRGKRRRSVETGRSWEWSQETGWTRNPRGPEPEEVCVPSPNLNPFPQPLFSPFSP